MRQHIDLRRWSTGSQCWWHSSGWLCQGSLGPNRTAPSSQICSRGKRSFLSRRAAQKAPNHSAPGLHRPRNCRCHRPRCTPLGERDLPHQSGRRHRRRSRCRSRDRCTAQVAFQATCKGVCPLNRTLLHTGIEHPPIRIPPFPRPADRREHPCTHSGQGWGMFPQALREHSPDSRGRNRH